MWKCTCYLGFETLLLQVLTGDFVIQNSQLRLVFFGFRLQFTLHGSVSEIAAVLRCGEPEASRTLPCVWFEPSRDAGRTLKFDYFLKEQGSVPASQEYH